MLADPNSYRITDFIPFSREVLRATNASYNEAIWPWQLFWVAMAIAIAYLLTARHRQGLKRGICLASLGIAWLFLGVTYHGMYFATINPPAQAYAWGFCLQGAGLLLAAVLHAKGFMSARDTPRRGLAAAFATLALLPWTWLASGLSGPLMLFGWSPVQTAAATLLVVTHLHGWAWRAALAGIPLIWLAVAGLTHYGLNSR
jgi:hypothetical protein